MLAFVGKIGNEVVGMCNIIKSNIKVCHANPIYWIIKTITCIFADIMHVYVWINASYCNI